MTHYGREALQPFLKSQSPLQEALGPAMANGGPPMLIGRGYNGAAACGENGKSVLGRVFNMLGVNGKSGGLAAMTTGHSTAKRRALTLLSGGSEPPPQARPLMTEVANQIA